jgi:hypothetical protein
MNNQSILANANDISLESLETRGSINFCTIWPNAKTALEMLAQLTKNPIVKSVIGIVIAGGDAVASRIC